MAPQLDEDKKHALRLLINSCTQMEDEKRDQILTLIENFTELDDRKKHALITGINKIMCCLVEMMDIIFEPERPAKDERG